MPPKTYYEKNTPSEALSKRMLRRKRRELAKEAAYIMKKVDPTQERPYDVDCLRCKAKPGQPCREGSTRCPPHQIRIDESNGCSHHAIKWDISNIEVLDLYPAHHYIPLHWYKPGYKSNHPAAYTRCPLCGSSMGDKCLSDKMNPIGSLHKERITAYENS